MPTVDLLKRNFKVNFQKQKIFPEKKSHFYFGTYLFIFVQIITNIQTNIIERQFIRNNVRTIGQKQDNKDN